MITRFKFFTMSYGDGSPHKSGLLYRLTVQNNELYFFIGGKGWIKSGFKSHHLQPYLNIKVTEIQDCEAALMINGS